jgi:hypothetical protein
MPLPYNPGTWKSFDPSNEGQMKVFLNQVSGCMAQLESQVSAASFLASILNGSGVLLGSAFSSKIVDLGTITTDQTVQATGANFVWVRFTTSTTQTRTITFTNLPQGAQVFIDMLTTAGTITLKLAATDTNSNTYTIQAWNSESQAIYNLVSGQAFANAVEQIFYGMTGFIGTSSSPRLNLIYA